MALRNINYMMDYEDNGGFGEDIFSQNEALANIINPPAAPTPVAAPIAATPIPVAATPTPTPTPTPAAPVVSPTAATPPTPATTSAPAKVDYTSALAKQILGSSDTSKWSGEGFGSAEKNAADMAKILANAGLTDVRQLGVKQVVVPAQYFESGEIPEHTVNNYYNKETGQDLGNLGGTYAERQVGNFFGGTFEGKGNTGYGVQFGPDGTPYFYTQGASSNDVAQIMQSLGPVGQIAAAYFGGPAAVAAIAVASGKDPVDIIKSTALSYLGSAAGSAVSGMEGITDVLGETGTNIVSNAAKQFVGSGGKVDPVQALLAGGVNAGVNSLAGELGFDKLDPSTQKLVSTGITGLVAGKTPEQIAIDLAMAGLNTKPDNKLTSSLGPGDMDEFNASLIPGYFQPGGEGYIPPEETNPITVQQEPTGLDDFLKQLEQFKQVAVTPDDIQKIISNQNFATPEDIQTAINTIDIPKGLSEQDVQAIVSNAFAENPGIGMEDIQSVVDKAVSKIPTGLTEDDLAQSLGTTKQDLLAQLGTTEEGLQQRIADLESEFGGQLTGATQGLESKIAGTQDSVDALAESLGTTKEDLLTQLGTTEEELQKQIGGVQTGLESKITSLGENFSSQLAESLGTTKEDLLDQLGVTEDEINQRIADLESEFGGQLTESTKGIESKITGLEEDFSDQLAKSLGTTKEDLLAELGITEESLQQRIADLESEFGGQLAKSTQGLESKLAETQTGVDELAESLGTTREDLLAELGVTEEEINQRIADLESEFGGSFKDIESSLGQTREDLLTEFGLSEEEMQQRIADLETEFGSNFEDIESSLGKTREELLAEFGVTEDEINQRIADLETEFGGNFSDIESNLEKTREELLAEFGLSEEEMAKRIADLETEFGGQLTSGLEKQSEATKAQFLNLTAAQKAQADALAKQGTDLTSAINQVQSTSNLNTLMMLLGSQQQQPVQQTTMQDPYADIKLMEDLFGSDIDLTPTGERTAQRK